MWWRSWWNTGVTLPARLACKACLHPCACPKCPLASPAFAPAGFGAAAFADAGWLAEPKRLGAKAGAQSWFRANLSALSTRRCHQISFLGDLARAAVIETASSEWRSEARPSSCARVSVFALWATTRQPWGLPSRSASARRLVGSEGNRTSCRKGTAFTAQRRHQLSLLALPENWRRAEGSNPGPRGPLGFRNRLPATPAALS